MSVSDVGEQLRIMYPGEPEAQISAAERVEEIYDDERRYYNKWALGYLAVGIASVVTASLGADGIIRIENYDLDQVVEALEFVGIVCGSLFTPRNILKAREAKISRQKTSATLNDLRAQSSY